MLRSHAQILTQLSMLADILWTGVAIVVSFEMVDLYHGILRDRFFSEQDLYVAFASLAIWATLLVFSADRSSQRDRSLAWTVADMGRINLWGMLLLVLVCYVIRWPVSRLYVAVLACTDFLILSAWRIVVRAVLARIRMRGCNTRTRLLVGTGPKALQYIEAVRRQPGAGLHLLGFVDTDCFPAAREVAAGAADGVVQTFPCLGELDDLPMILQENVVDEVVIAMPIGHPAVMSAIHMCEIQGVPASLLLEQVETTIARWEYRDMLGIPAVRFFTTNENPVALAAKRVLDIVVSSLLLVVLSPFFGVIALAVKLDSPGPVIYRSIRVGKGGRQFTLYKFRSMVQNAEELKALLLAANEMSGPAFKIKADPRITPVGRILRRTSLDELPQLFNVLKGDMSLVGPRPPLPDEVAQYEPRWRRRLSVKPGLTCLWQVGGRSEIDFDEWMRLDMEYIDNWSFGLDLRILLKTIPAVLTGRGAE
ncbi:MAG: sugar transferase [Kyrpidia sp.]|nr:sugar transferase [Kyrpidia sp.]